MDETEKSLQFKIIEELERKTLNQRGVIPLSEVHSVLEAVFHYYSFKQHAKAIASIFPALDKCYSSVGPGF